MFDPAGALLWIGVLAVGAWHGLNPAMGWPLAVANGLAQKRGAAVLATFVPLGLGHLLAMALVLVPFALLSWLMSWSREIRVGAGLLVVLFGVARLLFLRRHPRWMMRVAPTQLMLWSFLMATAHGAALMLLPFVIGLCETPAVAAGRAPGVLDHESVMLLMRSGVGTAVLVSLLHSAAMIACGLGMAWIVWRHLGLRALRAGWLDLDRAWALSLIVSGAAAMLPALPAASSFMGS